MPNAAWLVDMGYVVKTAGKGRFKIDYAAARAVLAERFGPTIDAGPADARWADAGEPTDGAGPAGGSTSNEVPGSSVRTFLFNGYDEAYGIPPGLQGFYAAMRHLGMTVCLHPMGGAASAGDHRQRRVDVDLAAHLVWQASRPDVDVVVVTTGDQDFLPAVKIAKEQFGKRVVVFSFDHSVSHALLEAAGERLLFEDFEERVSKR
ncbi:MAG: hypothetical protein JWO31_3413 [Phycisphaerales bacterium]|nr:hypothetical protein [Phycisphaerales bacterium]